VRIENLRSENKQNRARVAATVTWEDCDRPRQEIYFETPEEFGQDLTCNPHAFLVGCLMPAMRHGENRIAIDEEICPELRSGLVTAMSLMCHWYGSPRQPVRIEAKTAAHPLLTHTEERSGSFLSGGIDSLATLRTNRLDFPLSHPRSIKDCLFVFGFDMGATEGSDREIGTFERSLASLKPVVADAGITLIPVFTNVRHLDSDVQFWMHEFHGAALASVAHALSARLAIVSIASSPDTAFSSSPYGSHPLLDHNYSSAELQIRHDGVRFSRLDKVRIVADWDVALQNLRVCTANPSGGLNCGACEKCIRTMTELLAVGKLAHTRAFPVQDVSEALLGSIAITAEDIDCLYRELIEPLKAAGRLDLASVIEAKSTQFHKHLKWEREQDWKGTVKRFDRRYLNSGLFRFYKTARTRVKDVLASGHA
jgi:hypothetical protein